MLSLPDLLLASGIHLKQVGNEFSCLCFAHDDTNPSMSVYRNGEDKHVAHCLRGDTTVITRKGIFKISELSGSEHELLMPDGTWQLSPIKSYGEQKLWKINLTRNGAKKIIYATDKHRWFVRNKQTDTHTKDLIKNHRLKSAYPLKRISWNMDSIGICNGIMFGDGHKTKQGSRIALHGGKNVLSKYFEKIAKTIRDVCYLGRNMRLVNTGMQELKKFPSQDNSDEYLLGFIAGHIATDGCVSEAGDVSLACKDVNVILAVQDMCIRLSIGTYTVGNQLRLGYGKELSSIYKISFVGSTLSPELFLLPKHRERFEKKYLTRGYERRGWVVEKIEETDIIETVYCAEVENHHAFALEGNLLTGNCFSCGYHGDVISAYCELNGLDTKNPQHFLQAKKALESGDIYTGKPFATIENDTRKLNPRPERTMIVPDADTKPPKMNWLVGRDGRAWGEPDEVYIFRQPDGVHLMYEARWNITDTATGEMKKEPRPFSYGRRGSKPPNWECAQHANPRPIYGLDMLAKMQNKQVIVTEGPRKAFYAQQLLPMLPCVGCSGGAGSWSKSDWSPLKGKDVIIWPDADQTGRDGMDALAQHLIELECTAYILNTDDKPDGWDAADAVKSGWDTKQTLEWAKANKGNKVEKKTPEETVEHEPLLIELHTEESGSYDQPPYNDDEIQDIPFHIIEAQSHPVDYENAVFAKEPVDLFDKFVVPPLQRDMIPCVIANHIFDLAEVVNADPAFGVITAFTTLCGLLDDRIKIHLNEGFNQSARLWTVCVGEPSTKKSPLMDAVQRPVAEIIKKVAAEDSKVRQRQEVLDARHKAKLKKYTEACIDSDNHDVPEPMPEPRLERRRIKCDNLTREALEEILRDMPYGVHLHADELAGWIGSLDAYKAAGVKADRALWLRAFDGKEMYVDRIGRGSFLIDNWSVSISGGIQPSKLSAIAGQLDDDGLLQRFLVVCSDRAGGQGLNRPIRRDYYDAYANIFDAIAFTKHTSSYVHLTPEAAKIRDDSVTQLYEIINTGMIGRAFCTALGKWEGVSARLILIYHAIECATQGVHPANAHVQAGTARMAMHYMMHHLLPHMVSFYEDGLGQSDISDATRILAGRILAEKKTEVTLTWLGQHSPSKYRNLPEDKKKQVLSRLAEFGWLEPMGYLDGMSKKYKRYLVNPVCHERFAHLHEEEKDKLSKARDIAAKIRRGKVD